MSAPEYALWLAYYSIDPWDENRADARAARIAAMIAWVNGNDKYKITDAMPYLEKDKRVYIGRKSNKKPASEKLETSDVMGFIDKMNASV